jgi:hypothetical protein
MDRLPTIADTADGPTSTDRPAAGQPPRAPNSVGHPAVGRLSIQPLVDAIAAAGGMSALRERAVLQDRTHAHNDERLYYTLRKRGDCTLDQADRLAIGLLRRPPYEVWPWDDWFNAVCDADDDADEGED